MAAINPPGEWVADQTLDPLAAVDIYELSGDLTTGIPESTEEPEPEPEPEPPAKSTTKAKK